MGLEKCGAKLYNVSRRSAVTSSLNRKKNLRFWWNQLI